MSQSFKPPLFLQRGGKFAVVKVVEPDEIWFWIHVWCSSWQHDRSLKIIRSTAKYCIMKQLFFRGLEIFQPALSPSLTRP